MTTASQLLILPFKPEDQETVKILINTGLGEHWGITDPSHNPDLNDICSSYSQDYFMIAWLDGQIVGTGALVHRSEHTAEVVRMSVIPQVRRQGIGTNILNELVTKARELGYKKIILETTKTWQDVISFYLSYGFEITLITTDDIFFTYGL